MVSKQKDLAEVEARLTDPSVWADQAEAQKLMRRKSELSSSIESVEKIGGLVEESEILLDLAEDARDEASAKEARGKIEEAASVIAGVEVKRMLSGENDRLNAIVSIHPGAGGTEAQDWASILLRMYL
ncbi:MAG: PCRF domain-containing protein, partial [Deltaproteobacteria bacterium]|nr:PCRF domain-containing protein [Deltaproteobacteria bacterium]